MGPEPGSGKDVDYGGVREEVVVAEGLALGPVEEGEDKTGIVFDVEGNLGKVIWVEAVGVERVKVAPSGFGALVG